MTQQLNLRELPSFASHPGCAWLYACELSDGCIKVGWTRNPHTRIAMLRTELRRWRRLELLGVLVAKIQDPEAIKTAERDLLADLIALKPARVDGKEWFYGLPYAAVIDAVTFRADRKAAKLARQG